MKIPIQKGDHSCKCTELSLKRKMEFSYIRCSHVVYAIFLLRIEIWRKWMTQ